MRKMLVMVLVVLALGVMAGNALAENGGIVPPIRATYREPVAE